MKYICRDWKHFGTLQRAPFKEVGQFHQKVLPVLRSLDTIFTHTMFH